MFSQGIFGNPQRPTLQNRGPQNLQGQLQRQLDGQGILSSDQGMTNFMNRNRQRLLGARPSPGRLEPPRPNEPQITMGGGPADFYSPENQRRYNRGINPGVRLCRRRYILNRRVLHTPLVLDSESAFINFRIFHRYLPKIFFVILSAALAICAACCARIRSCAVSSRISATAICASIRSSVNSVCCRSFSLSRSRRS